MVDRADGALGPLGSMGRWIDGEHHVLGRTVRGYHLCLLLLFALALLLRVVNNQPSFFSYWFDESEYSVRARYIVEHDGGYDPVFLRDHPPLFPYLLAVPFAAIGPYWYVGRGFNIALSMVFLYVFFLIGRELGGRRLGLCLAGLFAISPIIVYLNREVTLDTLTNLFLCLSFLFFLRYIRDPQWHQMVVATAFFGLACITKEVAVLFALPILGLIVRRKLYMRPQVYAILLLLLVIVVPIYHSMGQSGFFSFHTKQVTMTTVHSMGARTIETDRFTSLLTFLGWCNVALVPVVMFIAERYKARKEGQGTARGKRWGAMFKGFDDRHQFLLLWLVGGVIFSLSITLMGPHYDIYPFIPFIIIVGYILRDVRRRTWLVTVAVTYLIVSICGISYFYQLKGSDKAVDYLRDHMSEGDSLVVSDSPIFIYYFPDHDVVPVSEKAIVDEAATYVVLKSAHRIRYLSNETVMAAMQDYVLVYETEVVEWDVRFYIYERQ